MELRPKKSLGQNFLKDEAVLWRIIESANLNNDDVVIEVGPGHGVLTQLLAEKCQQVISIELDDRLIEELQNKFNKNDNVEIIHGDILKINLPELVKRQTSNVKSYKVIANLPYYITSPIIRLFLETEIPPIKMIFMVQKEVAERITAKPGEMSILAVSVQYYAAVEYLFTVPAAAFEPKPKVDSAVIKLSSIVSSPSGRGCRVLTTGEGGVHKEETKKFFRLVRAGFSAKRKTLVNNLSNGLQVEKKAVEEKLESLGFSKNTRAQELGVDDWKKLAEKIK